VGEGVIVCVNGQGHASIAIVVLVCVGGFTIEAGLPHGCTLTRIASSRLKLPIWSCIFLYILSFHICTSDPSHLKAQICRTVSRLHAISHSPHPSLEKANAQSPSPNAYMNIFGSQRPHAHAEYVGYREKKEKTIHGRDKISGKAD
jgi:hypothetical protein